MSSSSCYRRPQLTSDSQPVVLRLVSIEDELQATSETEQVRQSQFQSWQAKWRHVREKLHDGLELIDSHLARLVGHERTPPQLKVVVAEEANSPKWHMPRPPRSA